MKRETRAAGHGREADRSGPSRKAKSRTQSGHHSLPLRERYEDLAARCLGEVERGERPELCSGPLSRALSHKGRGLRQIRSFPGDHVQSRFPDRQLVRDFLPKAVILVSTPLRSLPDNGRAAIKLFSPLTYRPLRIGVAFDNLRNMVRLCH